MPVKVSEAELFQLLMESVVDYAIFCLDPDGRVTTWNTGAERIKGWTAEEIIGQDFALFYPPEDREDGLPSRHLQTAAADGRCEDEGWRVRKDGSRFWANAVITPLREPDGALVGYAKVTRDLTERKNVEMAERRLVAFEERDRIGRELHRGIVRTLLGLGLRLQGAALRAQDPLIRQQLEAAVAELDDAVRELREEVYRG